MGESPTAVRRRTAGGLEVLGWPALERAGVHAVVTTRDGGVSVGPYRSLNLGLHVGDDPGAVVENRRRAAGAVGATVGELVFADQVHGTGVAVVDRSHRGRGATDASTALAATDVLVTATPEPVLVIMVADCVPVVLVDPEARVLAVVHAGWRGTADRAVVAGLRAMAALGGDPARTVAGIGPAASPRTYEVGEEVAAAVGGALGAGPPGPPVLTPSAGGRWLLDLQEANAVLLRAAGVPAPAIHVARYATGPGGPFFSDRQARPCGRFALLARLGRPDGGPPARP